MADIRDKVPLDELLAEQQEIEDVYKTMRFSQKIRHASLACFKAAGGKPGYPFRVDQIALVGKDYVNFGDCMNVKFEEGPYLRELGDIPEGAIPKKFVWAHGL